MADVRLDFIPPDIPDLTKLHIYEAPAADGTFNPIEEVTAIGEYPNYISYYTTELAIDDEDWFAIEWEDSKGALFGISQPVQGNTQTAVGRIVQYALLRDSSINEIIAAQEAEAVVELVMGTSDPLSVLSTSVTANQLSGMTLLTMARVYMMSVISSGSSESFTAGLVSMKSGNQRDLRGIEDIIKAANLLLNRNYSVVAVMESVEIPGLGSIVSADHSRLIVEWE